VVFLFVDFEIARVNRNGWKKRAFAYAKKL
jgi:hypothetical protein